MSVSHFGKSQLGLKTVFHSNYTVLLYCFVKWGSLLSSWVIGESPSKNNVPLPAPWPPFAQLCTRPTTRCIKNSHLVGEDESEDLRHIPWWRPEKFWTRWNKLLKCRTVSRESYHVTYFYMIIFFFSPFVAPLQQFQGSWENTFELALLTDVCWERVSGSLVEGGSNYAIWVWWSPEGILALQH